MTGTAKPGVCRTKVRTGTRGREEVASRNARGGAVCRPEPKRLRLRLFSVAGRLARGGRRLRLRLAQRWPRASEITAAVTRLQALPSG